MIHFFVELARLCREGGDTRETRRKAMAKRLTQNLLEDITAFTKSGGNHDGKCPDIDALQHCFGEKILGPYPFQLGPENPGSRRGDDKEEVGATAIILPYRNRALNFRYWMFIMLPLLAESMDRPFGIFLIELEAYDANKKRLEYEGFNLALLKNAGVLEAKKASPLFDCFVTYDIDYILTTTAQALKDGKCRFTCEKDNFVQYSSNRLNHKCHRGNIGCGYGVRWTKVGGVVAGRWEHWSETDGFPMNCWGWGGEDTAFASRIKNQYGDFPIEWAPSAPWDGNTRVDPRKQKFIDVPNKECFFWDLDVAGHNHENDKESSRLNAIKRLHPVHLDEHEQEVEAFYNKYNAKNNIFCGNGPYISAGSPGAAGLSFDGYVTATHVKTALYTHIGIEGKRHAIDDYTYDHIKGTHWDQYYHEGRK